MERRKMLALLGGVGTVGLAGCNGGGDDDGNESENGNQSDDGGGNGGAGGQIEGRWGGRSTGGMVLFGEDGTEEDFRSGGLGLPPEGQISEPVEFLAEFNEDGATEGEWESVEINFPALNIASLPDEVVPEVNDVDGFSGTLNYEEELFTVEGTLRVTLSLDGEESTIDFPLESTTKTSGELEGSFEERDDGSLEVTVVDNQSRVPDSFGIPAVDVVLGLPADFEGDNWFELDLIIENRENDATIE
jgi:hypothetical protein